MALCHLLLLAAAASARVIDRLAAVPKGWEESRVASPDEPIFLRVALTQQPSRIHSLDQAVLEMSTPGHPNYGMHMTRDELRSYTAPSDDAVSAVTGWLEQHAIKPLVDHDWVSFTTTVRVANELLGTQFAWYKYLDGIGGPALRALSYSVPDHVAVHINLVQPTTRFGNLGARKSSVFDMHSLELDNAIIPDTKAHYVADEDDLAACTYSITPDCLRSIYNIHYKPATPENSKVAFASFLEEYARYGDMQDFEQRLVPDAVGMNFSVELVNNGLDDQASGSDSSKCLVPVLDYSLRSTILTPARRGQPRRSVPPRHQPPDSHGRVQRRRAWPPRPHGGPALPARQQRALS
jgi:tripeptidyl-peptidase I